MKKFMFVAGIAAILGGVALTASSMLEEDAIVLDASDLCCTDICGEDPDIVNEPIDLNR